MRPLRSTMTASLLALSACAPHNDATEVAPLTAQTTPEQRVVEAGLSRSLAPAEVFEAFGKAEGDRSFHADIAFYEVVLSYGPVADPRPIFLLTNAYIVTNQQSYGLSYLERLLKRYESAMSDDTRAVYLSAYALLRATYAERVPIPGRIFWLLDTFDILEDAKRLAESNPVVRWSAGLIYAQVPRFFGKSDEGLAELLWLIEHPELEPTPGFYREAYHFLSRLYAKKGQQALADQYLRKSGYEDYEPSVLFTGWFATTKEKGLLFAPTPAIDEVVPGRVFTVRGFGFSDVHFVVSDDRKELISIDAGTQPFSMEAAHRFFRERYPDPPPLTTVLVTHVLTAVSKRGMLAL